MPLSASQSLNSLLGTIQSAGTSSSGLRVNSISSKSYLDRRDPADISYGTPVPWTHIQTMTTPPGQGTASSVIGAFRQLQAKSRRIEQERLEAVRERLGLVSVHLSDLFCFIRVEYCLWYDTFARSSRDCTIISITELHWHYHCNISNPFIVIGYCQYLKMHSYIHDSNFVNYGIK